MNANLTVIADNIDYLLWGRLAEGQPGGVALTLLMAIGATLLALPGGIALAGLAWRYGGLVRRLLFLWAEIIRGIPLIFVIFWLWYLLPMLTGGDLPGAVTVTLALAWFTAASVMHSVLAGLQSLPKGQYEAALTQGFAPGQTLRLVLLPQALRNVQPSLVGIFIGLLKDTSLAFIVNAASDLEILSRAHGRDSALDFLRQQAGAKYPADLAALAARHGPAWLDRIDADPPDGADWNLAGGRPGEVDDRVEHRRDCIAQVGAAVFGRRGRARHARRPGRLAVRDRDARAAARRLRHPQVSSAAPAILGPRLPAPASPCNARCSPKSPSSPAWCSRCKPTWTPRTATASRSCA